MVVSKQTYTFLYVCLSGLYVCLVYVCLAVCLFNKQTYKDRCVYVCLCLFVYLFVYLCLFVYFGGLIF